MVTLQGVSLCSDQTMEALGWKNDPFSTEAKGLLIYLPRLSFPLILGGKGHHIGG